MYPEANTRLEELALLVELGRIEAGAQKTDDDEGARMGGHGAHDEVQVAGGDRLPIHAREVLHGLGVVLALVLAMGLLNFPIVDDVLVLLAGRGVSIGERELRLLERRQRVFEERTLLHLT